MPDTATSQALDDTDEHSDLSEAQCLAGSAIESDKQLDIFRQQRKEYMKHFAGPYYGEQDSEVKWRQALNFIFSLASTLEPTLAMRLLRSGVSTHNEDIRPFCSRLRLGLDRVTEKAKVPKALRVAIRDALFGMGVIKTYQEKAGERPRCESISLDDYVIDHRARSRQPGAYAYEGHRFRMLYEELMDSNRLDGAAKKVMKTQAKEQWRNESERAEKIGRGGPHIGDTAFQAQIELAEFYLPHDNRIVWLPGNLNAAPKDYLWEGKYYGSTDDGGPYNTLGFYWLSDNTIAVPIMGIIFDLYLLENKIANKIARQADAQKDIALVHAPSPKDGDSIRKAQDGEFVHAPGAEGKVLSIGGANEKGYQAFALFHDLLNRLAGNVDLLGGTKAESKTLGQTQLLMGKATIATDDMRGYVLDTAESVARKFAWYMWEDPKLDMRLTQSLGKAGDLALRWRPGQRMGEFEDYDISISVAGRHSDTPEQKADRMAQWVQTYVLPVMALAAQQGSRLNVDLLVNTAGRLMDIDEIEELWEEGEPIESPTVGPARGTHTGTEGPAAPRLTAGRVPPRPVEAMAVPTGGP